MTYIPGTGATLSLGSVFKITEMSAKLLQGVKELYLTGEAGWATQVPDCGKKLEGSVSGPIDDANIGTNTFPAPFSTSLADLEMGINAVYKFTCTVATSNWSYTHDAEGVEMWSCDIVSSGVVTYVSS